MQGEGDISADEHRAATRRVIAILAVCGFASTFAVRFLDPLIGVISRDLGSDPHTIALLATAFALPYAFIQPVLGPVGDALGKERVVKVCLGVLACTLGASILVSDVGLLFTLRVLSGAAAGGVIPLALATIGDRVVLAERQVALSRFLTFSILGQLVGGSMSGFLAEWVGWRGVFALAAVLAAAATAAVIVGFRRASVTVGRFSMEVAAARYIRILGVTRARYLFAFVFIEGGIIFGIQPYIAPMLEARGAGGPAQAGIVIACFATGGVIYTLAVPLFLRLLGVARMLMLAGALAGAAFLVLSVGAAWKVDAAAMLGMGIGFWMLHNSYQTQVTEVAPEARASAVSLHAFSYFVGQALGPALFGLGLVSLGEGPTKWICAFLILCLGIASSRILFGAQRAR
jgi:predicted MFS family arabinose efflux permease